MIKSKNKYLSYDEKTGMEYRKLGNSGLDISVLSFGFWITTSDQMSEELATSLVKTAFENGVNFFDNAEGYGKGYAETTMGKAFKNLKLQRDGIVVSSKVFFASKENPSPTQRGLSRKHIIEACYQALDRIGIDYLDLYFCHRPDPSCPIEEVVRSMNELILRGKIFYWGTSEWSAQQITQAHMSAKELGLVPPLMEQPQYNMLARHRFEVEYKRLFSQFGMGTTIFSPLGAGFLTGKYNNGIPEGSRASLPRYSWLKEKVQSNDMQKQIEKLKKLELYAKEKFDTSLTNLSLAWCMQNENVSSVILGASKVNQLAQNFQSLEIYKKLTDEHMKEIEDIMQNAPNQMDLQ